MQKALLLFILSLLSVGGFTQTVIPPAWDQDIIEFKTAKLQVRDSKTNKIVSDGYKDATIVIVDAKTVTPEITIDIPDRYFIKSGRTGTMEYKNDGKTEAISYSIISEKKMAAVYFSYDAITGKLIVISIVATDNYLQTPVKTLNFVLYEQK